MKFAIHYLILVFALVGALARADFHTTPFATAIGGTARTDISSAEFGYLIGTTSNIQAQIRAIPGASFPFVIPNSSTPNIISDSDTGFAFPSDGLVNVYNNAVKTTEFQPSVVKFDVPVDVTAAGLVLPAVGSNLFSAGPTSGAPATPSFRAIGAGDIPSSAIPYPLLIPVGAGLSIRDSGDGDTGFDFPSDGVIDIYANGVLTQDITPANTLFIGGVTVTGNLNVGGNIGFPVQNANKVFAGPTSGSDAAPTFRNLVSEDIPQIDISTSTHVTGTLSIGNGGTGASNMGPFGSIPYHKDPGILATDYDGLNYNDADQHLQVKNWNINGEWIDQSFQTASINGRLVGVTTGVRSDTLRVSRNMEGTFLYIQGPTNADQLNGVQSPLVIASGVDININSASHIGLYKGDQTAPQISADSQIDQYIGRSNTPSLRGNIGDVILDQISANVDNTLQPITGNFRAQQINVNNITAQHVVGLEINVQDTNVNSAGGRPGSLSANGASFSLNSQALPLTVSPGFSPDVVNNMNTQFSVIPGSPVMPYGDVIGVAQSMSLSVSTSIPSGGLGFGIAAVAYANLFGAEVGVTVPEFGGAVAALVNTFGSQGQDGGDLGTAYGFKSYGVLNGGGSNIIHRGIGFWAQAGSCAGITGDCFALKSDDASAMIETLGTINGASPIELGYLAGLTGNVQAQINAGGGGGGPFVLLAGDTMTGALIVAGNLTSGDVTNSIASSNSFSSGAGNNISAGSDNSAAFGGTQTITSAYGGFNFAAGNNNVVNGAGNSTFGSTNTLNGFNGFSAGTNNFIQSAGGPSTVNGAFVTGDSNKCDGQQCAAFGSGVQANGGHSLAAGEGTIANATNSTVIGQYNDPQTAQGFEFGCGANSGSRANCFQVTTAGDATISNSLAVPTIDGASSTEIGYLVGVTAPVQTQINSIVMGSGFVPTTGGTMTGTLRVDDGTQHTDFAAGLIAWTDGIENSTVNMGTGELIDTNNLPSLGWNIPNTVSIETGHNLQLADQTSDRVAVIGASSTLYSSSAISITELNTLDGITANIQGQFNAIALAKGGYIDSACSFQEGSSGVGSTGSASSTGCVITLPTAPNGWACGLTSTSTSLEPATTAHSNVSYSYQTAITNAGVSFSCVAY